MLKEQFALTDQVSVTVALWWFTVPMCLAQIIGVKGWTGKLEAVLLALASCCVQPKFDGIPIMPFIHAAAYLFGLAGDPMNAVATMAHLNTGSRLPLLIYAAMVYYWKRVSTAANPVLREALKLVLTELEPDTPLYHSIARVRDQVEDGLVLEHQDILRTEAILKEDGGISDLASAKLRSAITTNRLIHDISGLLQGLVTILSVAGSMPIINHSGSGSKRLQLKGDSDSGMEAGDEQSANESCGEDTDEELMQIAQEMDARCTVLKHPSGEALPPMKDAVRDIIARRDRKTLQHLRESVTRGVVPPRLTLPMGIDPHRDDKKEDKGNNNNNEGGNNDNLRYGQYKKEILKHSSIVTNTVPAIVTPQGKVWADKALEFCKGQLTLLCGTTTDLTFRLNGRAVAESNQILTVYEKAVKDFYDSPGESSLRLFQEATLPAFATIDQWVDPSKLYFLVLLEDIRRTVLTLNDSVAAKIRKAAVGSLVLKGSKPAGDLAAFLSTTKIGSATPESSITTGLCCKDHYRRYILEMISQMKNEGCLDPHKKVYALDVLLRTLAAYEEDTGVKSEITNHSNELMTTVEAYVVEALREVTSAEDAAIVIVTYV